MTVEELKKYISNKDEIKHIYILYSDKHGYFQDVGFVDKACKRWKPIWADKFISGNAWYTRKNAAQFQQELLKIFGIKTRIIKI